ncbi:MAG: translational repressor RegA [Candidatus Woesearchaeota archaeon]
MIEVTLKTDKKVIIETLTRIGIANKKKKIIYPSCYLYEKDGKNYICHFKELFKLTRKNAYDTMCEDDNLRLKATCFCLKTWGLLEVDDSSIDPHNKYVFVLNFKDKPEWKISHKFNIKNLYISDKKIS